MTKYADRGKWAEDQVRSWLELRSSKEAGFAYHRYPDARAARGALPPQPADYLVARRITGMAPFATHLEVKETGNLTKLPKDKIGQYGKLRMFDGAGFDTVVLVYRTKLDDWVVLRGSELFGHEVTPTSFPLTDRTTYPTAAAALDETFS